MENFYENHYVYYIEFLTKLSTHFSYFIFLNHPNEDNEYEQTSFVNK